MSKSNEYEYWEKRYRKGGTSGVGSTGEIRDWKWKIIQEHVGEIDNVLDVGCGDLSFWEGRDCAEYLGIDISQTIIEQNRKSRPHWKFKVHQAGVPLHVQARIVLCLDVLFHIIDDNSFVRICQNLCTYSTEWICIHNVA